MAFFLFSKENWNIRSDRGYNLPLFQNLVKRVDAWDTWNVDLSHSPISVLSREKTCKKRDTQECDGK